MAAYVKITNFAVKDGLLSGNPSKIVSGSEIDAELNAIALSSSQNLTAITDAQTATASSASAAATSATNAATSATNASTSATTATTQASNASTSATNAASSATSASTSASTATTQASNASTSATNAASSASAAATSETNAATSASTASTQASNASTSATNAANSATTATTQATNAATSATNAATSATTAETAAQAVAIKWTFSTTTTMADPGSGIIRFNNATPASVTAIAVDDNNSSAQDISAYVIAWDDSTSTNKGTLTIKQGTSLAIYTITTLTDNVGWTELAVTYVSGAGTFSDATATFVTFLRTGDKGATGTGDALVANPLSQFAATTSAQLAGVISDETGSGALVFATSPTLVTPALGTPSSGTLTSCTGLPQAGTVGLTTADSPQFAALNIGHASDTTLTRVSAGVVAVEGNAVYVAGGTDVAVADGGTGASTLTANNVILGNGASAVQFVAPSTSGNVLTSNGTTWASSTPAGGGAWVYLSTVTASASATVDIETTFDSTYDRYVIEAVGVTTANDGIQLLARLKIGGSYIADTTYYGHSTSMSSDFATYSNAVAFRPAGGDTGLVIMPNSNNAADCSTDFTMTVSKPSGTTFMKSAYWIGRSNGATSTSRTTFGAGHNSGTAALTGVRFLAQTGNILAGTFRLYGIKNS